MPPLAAVLFDLDGTLVDSAADIAASANHVRASLGRPPLPIPAVARMIGDGVEILLERALADIPGWDRVAAVTTYRAHYRVHCCDTTRAYPGIAEALAALDGRALAVVTNKPAGFSEQILDHCGLRGRFRVVVGGDTVATKKPDAAPFRFALERCGLARGARAAMVGDASGDIEGGRAVGLLTCAVGWGIGDREALMATRPDHVAETPADLARILRAAGTA